MWQKRLKGYASIGYTMKPNESEVAENQNALYNGAAFLPVITKDMLAAKKSLFISSPYLTKSAVMKFIPLVSKLIVLGVKIFIVTKERPETAREKVLPLVEQLKNLGCAVRDLPDLSQRCTVIDEKLIWYGSTDILGWVEEDDCMLRFEDVKIAAEAMGMMGFC